jgi:capsular polysaccharide transport system permease protein
MVARSPIRIFLAVQKALFIREINMRITESKTGFFWTFFEPFMQVLTMVLVKLFIFGSSGDSFDFAAFLALNFVAFNLFKNILIRSVNAFNANKTLFIYKQVKPIDTIFARVAVEIYISMIIVLVFVIIGYYYKYDLNIENLPLVVLGFIIIVFFAISLSLPLAVGNMFYPSLSKIVSISITFLMFGSSVFYTIDMLPSPLKEYILLNPLTHILEFIHGNYFYVLDTYYVNYFYIVLWIIINLYIGLKIYKIFEEKIISL